MDETRMRKKRENLTSGEERFAWKKEYGKEGGQQVKNKSDRSNWPCQLFI